MLVMLPSRTPRQEMMMGISDPQPDAVPPDLLDGDDGRLHAICVRPLGPFERFDQRLTALATRFTSRLRVTIIRSWDFAAQHEWTGFVSRSVPTILVVRAGRVIAKSVGDLQTFDLDAILRPGAA